MGTVFGSTKKRLSVILFAYYNVDYYASSFISVCYPFFFRGIAHFQKREIRKNGRNDL